jgi:hypothetical protein
MLRNWKDVKNKYVVTEFTIGEEEIDIYGLADTNYVKTRRDGRLDIKARPEIVRRSRTRKTQMISEIKLQTYASALDR